MAEIFLYTHDAGINPQQLQKLRREGFIPVGVSCLSAAKVLPMPVPLRQANGDMILHAAALAIKGWDSASKDFGRELSKLLIAANPQGASNANYPLATGTMRRYRSSATGRRREAE